MKTLTAFFSAGGYTASLAKRVAEAAGVDVGRISVKATTEEKLGFTGEGLGIAAHAVVLLEEEAK